MGKYLYSMLSSLALLGTVSVLGAPPANAAVVVGIGPGAHHHARVVVAPARVYARAYPRSYYPAPVYYAPPPVYYYPPPVVYAPPVYYSPPVYYAPRVAYAQPVYRSYYQGHGGYVGHGGHRR
jgi:hypothetical protein